MLQLDILTQTQHLIGISGKDSLATALLQSELHPEFDYQYFFNDNGCELPETYQWLTKVEGKTGWKIVHIGESLEAKIHYKNGFLPNHFSRYCTAQTKIKPLEKFQKGTPTYLYLGLRADEDRGGFKPPNNLIHPIYPLKENGITLPVVWKMLEHADLLPPSFFWKRLYDEVCSDYDPIKWQDKLQPWQFRILFAGRSRNNSYFCFFQRQYEWVWLLETHPELFERAVAFEKTDYTWVKGKPLPTLKKQAEEIFNRHVQKIIKILQGIEKLDIDNALALTSCGMMCGK